MTVKPIESEALRLLFAADDDVGVAVPPTLVLSPQARTVVEDDEPDVDLPLCQVGSELAYTPEEVVYLAVQLLAGNDPDLARQRNDIGFNRMHAQYGHVLAQKPFRQWNARDFWSARRMLETYKNTQLRGIVEFMPPFQKDPPKSSYDLARERRASERGYDKPLRYRMVTLDQVGGMDVAVIQQDYDTFTELSGQIKGLPQRRYDKDQKRWYVPLHLDALEPLVAFATANGYDMPDDIGSKIADKLAGFQDQLALSAAADTDLELDLPGGLALFPFQKAGVAYAHRVGNVLIADEMGLGKGSTLSTGILTPTGWTTHGEVRVGDRVIGSDGHPCLVAGVYPRGELDVFRVTFQDGSSVTVDGDHLWAVNSPLRRSRGRPNQVLSTRELMDAPLSHANGNRQRFIPMVAPVEFDGSPLPIDPYVLGVLIGDGSFTKNSVSYMKPDRWMAGEVARLLPDTMSLREWSEEHNYGITGAVGVMRELGLQGCRSWEKFVPDIYKFATVEGRTSILQGILDTDGHVRPEDNNVEFGTSSEQLAKDVQFLVESLGGVAPIRVKTEPTYIHNGEKLVGRPCYRMSVQLPPTIRPFRTPIKSDVYHPREKYAPSRSIVSIEPAGREEVVCIAVDAPDNLYVTEHCIVTHNTVQALAALKLADQFPAVVICPASLKRNWEREARKWLPDKKISVINGSYSHSLTFMGQQPLVDVVIVNYNAQILSAWDEYLEELGPKAIVLDEAHACKNPKAQQTKLVKQLVRRTKARVIALSGTPVVNRPMEFWQLIDILGHGKTFGGLADYKRRYDNDRQQAHHELNTRARTQFMVRRLKKDVLTELPDKLYSIVPIDLDNRDKYERIEADIAGYFATKKVEDAEFNRTVAFEAQQRGLSGEQAQAYATARRKEHFNQSYVLAQRAEQLLRWEALKRCAVDGKLAGVLRWIDEFLESGEKLVVFVSHVDVGKQIAAKYGADFIYGGMPTDERQRAVDRFQQRPERRVIVGNLIAAGEGLTLTAASNVAFVELGWNRKTHAQAEDRCHRIGQKDTVNVYTLVAERTIEEEIAALIERKRVVAEAIQDGDADTQAEFMSELQSRLDAKLKKG